MVKNKLLVILGGLLFLSLVWNVWQLKSQIYQNEESSEFVKLSNIDSKYSNKLSETLKLCNEVSEIRSNITTVIRGNAGDLALANLLGELGPKYKALTEYTDNLKQIEVERNILQINSQKAYSKIFK